MKTLQTSNTPKPLSKILIGSATNENQMSLNCKKHGDYVGVMMRITASKYLPSRCPSCDEEMKQREFKYAHEKNAIAKQHKIASLFGKAGIPERFKERTFANYRILNKSQEHVLNVACQYATQFADRLAQGGGLIFAGKPGTGKTHLAAAIAKQVMNSGRSVLFISVLRAIRLVKECYRKQSVKTEQQVIENFIAPDLLILDEVGVQFGTDTEKLILFEIINGRYEAVLPTILISNLTEAELTHYVGARIMDRLQEGGGVSLSFDWETYRKHVHTDSALPKRCVPDVRWNV